jgi:hypothetical protein
MTLPKTTSTQNDFQENDCPKRLSAEIVFYQWGLCQNEIDVGKMTLPENDNLEPTLQVTWSLYKPRPRNKIHGSSNLSHDQSTLAILDNFTKKALHVQYAHINTRQY